MDVTDEGQIADTNLIDHVLPSRIVVPLNGSYDSMRAVPHATDLARRFGASLSLITVPDPLEYDRPFDVPSWLRVLRDRVDLDRVKSVVTEPGDRVRTILDIVDGQEPTALCLATHARRGVPEVVHHHVAQNVLRGVRSPAWVVGRECSRHPRTGPIVVCHDGSEAANAVVGPARAWACGLGAPTRLIHVVDALDRDAGPTLAVTWALEQLGLDNDPVPVHGAFPIEAITEFARTVGACAIAVARPPADDHDRTIGRLPSGLIRASSCPVLLARGGAR